MKRRIFIAINLPEDVKKSLVDYKNEWPDLPARWINPENIHVTLEFLGYLNDDELVEICRIAKNVAAKNASFEISLKKICYGPTDKMPPRMVWAIGEPVQELSVLQKDLKDALSGEEKINFVPENRQFQPHITLARILQWQWRRIEPEERPQIEEEIDLTFPVNSIEVMESELRRGRPKYTVHETYNLKLGT